MAIQLNASEAPPQDTVKPALDFPRRLTPFLVFSSKTRITGFCLNGFTKVTLAAPAGTR